MECDGESVEVMAAAKAAPAVGGVARAASSPPEGSYLTTLASTDDLASTGRVGAAISASEAACSAGGASDCAALNASSKTAAAAECASGGRAVSRRSSVDGARDGGAPSGALAAAGAASLVDAGGARVAPSPALPNACRDVSVFTVERQGTGQGTFGVVSIARDPDGSRVALKRLFMKDELDGFPFSVLREIKALRVLTHPNIARLREVATSAPNPESNEEQIRLGHVFLVFDAADGDLEGLSKFHAPGLLDAAHVRAYMWQLLSGLAFIHARGYLHRDIKPSNLLLSRAHKLSIADFGLSKKWRQGLPTSTKTCTLWYRAPELLLGDTSSATPVDVWSAGVVFFNLMQVCGARRAPRPAVRRRARVSSPTPPSLLSTARSPSPSRCTMTKPPSRRRSGRFAARPRRRRGRASTGSNIGKRSAQSAR